MRGKAREWNSVLYRLHPENDVPQILHDPTRLPIAQLRPYHPLANLDVVFPRPFPNLLPGDGELGATRDGEGGVGYGLCSRGPIEKRCAGLVEDFLPHLPRDMLVPSGGFVAAAWGPVAAEVDVAVLPDECELEVLESVDVVVQWVVRVPSAQEARAVRVDEGYGGGEGGVVVDYVGQVRH